MINITKDNSQLETMGHFLKKETLKQNPQTDSYSTINIPLYQRDYSWNSESISNFLEMFDKILDSKFSSKAIYFGNIFYYFDSKNSKTIDIVDGQQRITTIHILLFAMRNIIKSNNWNIEDDKFEKINREINYMLFTGNDKFRIYHSNKRERRSFTEMVEYSEKECNAKNILKNQNIFLKNYGFIHQWLVNKEETKEISEVKQKIIDILAILDKYINIGLFCLDNIDEAITTFSTINSTGQNLTILDLLKSEIFSLAKENKKEREFDDEWQIFLSVLNCEGSIYKNDYDKFLQHFLFSRYKHTKKTELKDSKNEWMKNKKDSIEIVKDMTKYMNSFLDLFKNHDILSSEIKLLRFYQHIPIAINIYENFRNDNPHLIIQKIHELLISIVVINNEQANFFESIMVDLSKETKEAKEISKVKQKINGYIANALGDYERKVFIDRLIDINFKKTDYIKFFFSKTSLKNEKKINWKTSTLEHICPIISKKWEKDYSEDNFKNMIYKIGNATILESKLNTAISNEKFSKKKEMILEVLNYDGKSNSIIKGKKTNNIYHKIIEEEFFKEESFLNQDNWTEKNVKNRTKIICDCLFEYDFMKEI